MRERRHGFRYYASLMSLAGGLLTLAMLISCGGNGPQTTPSLSGTVTTSISDPPTCQAPSGPFSNVWVTITKVTAHINADAGSSDSGWVTLVDKTSSPKQIDLLSLASTTCVLNQLGSTTGLPPGKYQQIRLYLLANDASGGPSPNQCGTGFNCVVLADGSTVTLNLSSEAQTGLKIPPGQIAGGGLDIMAGQSADLNIDFDACSSIVRQGNGQFRLKPTLHAGEVALNQNSLSGRVVDSVSKSPIAGAVISLEQPSNGVDRIQRSALSASDGTFFFCPLPSGNYDVVVTASTATTTYNATATLQVPLGTALGDIALVPETGATTPSTINGLVTTATATPAATSADITLYALQSATPPGGSAVTVTIPLFAGSTSFPLVTAASTATLTCPTNTDCANYTLLVPGSNPRAGTFSSSGTSYSAPTGNAAYSIEADVTASDGTADCSSSTLTITTDNATPTPNPLAVAPGGTVTAATATFTGCQ